MAQATETKKWLIAYEHDLRIFRFLTAETEEQATEIFRSENPMIVSTAPVRITEDKIVIWREVGKE